MKFFDRFRKAAQNTTIKTQTDIIDLDSTSYNKFTEAIDDFKDKVSSKKALKPSTSKRHQELLSYVEQLQSTYTPELITQFSIDEQKKFMTALADSIKYSKKDGVSMTVEMLKGNVKEKVNIATEEILSTRLADPNLETTRPNIKRPDGQKSELKQTSSLSESELSSKLSALKINLATLSYDNLLEDQSYGKFMQDKLSGTEFDQIKAIVAELNIVDIKQEISDKGFFSIKKAEIGRKSEVKQGEHSMVMEGLPRSVVITNRGGELEFTILTKSKTADGKPKDESAKFRGGNSTASRALRFSSSEQAGLEMDTVIIKTSNDKSVSEKWYQEASTDPLDKPTRAPNGMFVEDGGSPALQNIDSLEETLDPTLTEHRSKIVEGMVKATAQLKSIHGDIKPANILVNSRQEVRIIDFPIDIETARKNRYEKTHFQDGFKAQNLSELVGKIHNPQSISFIDDTTGKSTIALVNPGDGDIWQQGFDDPLTTTLGISSELNQGLSNSVSLINNLQTAFYVNSANHLDPKYNDIWGILGSAEKLFLDSDTPLSINDKQQLFQIQTQKKQMLQDLSDLCQSVPDELVEILNSINNQIGEIEYKINIICQNVNDKSMHKNLPNVLQQCKSFLSPDLQSKITELTDPPNEQRLTEIVQDSMSDLISQRDVLGSKLDSLTSFPLIQSLDIQMNERWNPVTLATNLGITLDLNKLQGQELERDSLESKAATTRESIDSMESISSLSSSLESKDATTRESIDSRESLSSLSSSTDRQAILSDSDRDSFLKALKDQDLKELEDIKQDLAKSITLKSDTLGKSKSFRDNVGQEEKENSRNR